MKSRPKPGEHVTWNSPRGKIEGEVIGVVTSTASVKDQKAKATTAIPQFLVKSEKTGQKASVNRLP